MMSMESKTLSAYERWELPVLTQAENLQPFAQSQESLSFPTAEELESIRLEAKKIGFSEGKSEGYQAGYREGHAEGQQEIEKAIVFFNHLAAQLANPLKKQEEATEQLLLQIVENVSMHILQRELSINSQGILSVLKQALSNLPLNQRQIKIFLNSQDKKLVERFLSQQLDADYVWNLYEKNSLSPGGCVIETDQVLLDASVKGRFQQLIHQLYKNDDVNLNDSKFFMDKQTLLSDIE